MVGSGRIRLPMALDAKVREDFTFVVTAQPRRAARFGLARAFS